MAISRSMLPAVLLFHILLSFKSMAVISQSSHTVADVHSHLIDEIREAELKIVRLESILEECNSVLDSKNVYIKEREKLVKDLTDEFDHLQSVLLTMKNDSSCANERFKQLEEEVRLLWDTARRNNFELHSLESEAEAAENRMKVTNSRVETMTAIVTEQWIQVQHLEQALVIAKYNGRVEVKSRCSFLKLQRFVKQEMQKWKYTAAFADKEVVFFVASALITFPALSIGVFILNNLW